MGKRRNLEYFDKHSQHSARAMPQPQARHGGARRDRTDDLLLAKQALSQLSYGPARRGNALILRPP